MSKIHAEQQEVSISPLVQRALEANVAEAFLLTLRETLGEKEAIRIFRQAVGRLAASAAASFEEKNRSPLPLLGLWEVWLHLGGDGRLDLHLDELSEKRLRFHIDHCVYADMYRARGQEEIGILFSCQRDGPFAQALIPGIHVQQSKTILEGSPRCEFTYSLEEE